MVSKIPEAELRLFERKWICRRCKKKIKADTDKILAGKIQCPKCGGKQLRKKKKEKKKGLHK